MIDPLIARRFEPYLLAGERIVWTARPKAGIMFTALDFFVVPFSLLWGGFAFFWEALVLLQGAPWPFALYGVPFVLIGLFMIVGRFIADAWVRDRTIYAMTSRRALLLKDIGRPWLNSAPLGVGVNLKDQDASGRGTLDFTTASFMGGFFRTRNPWMPSLEGGVRFLGVERVRDAYRLATESAPAP